MIASHPDPRQSASAGTGRDQTRRVSTDSTSALLAAAHAALPRDIGARPLGLCLSGGSDSCALALAAAGAALPVDVVALHARHRLRGAESEADALSVRELCAGLGIPLIEVDAEVAPGPNLEARARQARYRALREAFPGLLATAHHRGDQAETVVLRLLRGAGPAGLRGIHALREDGIWRPFLGLPRSRLEETCREAGWTWREDASNRDQRFLRNWVRHVWLPEGGDAIEAALVRLSSSAAALAPFLEARLESLESICSVSCDATGFRIDLRPWDAPGDHPELDLLLERLWSRSGRRPWAAAQRRRLVDDVLSRGRGRRLGGQREVAIWGGGLLQVRLHRSAQAT